MAATQDLQTTIAEYLREYADECREAVNETIEEVATEGTKRLRASSPGSLGKGWTKTTEKSRIGTSVIIHGKGKTGSVGHLVENGHAKRGGGRVNGRVFIAPVEEWTVSEVVERIEKKLEGIG